MPASVRSKPNSTEHKRKQDTRLKIILDVGAVAAKLVDRCLQHVSKDDRTFVLARLFGLRKAIELS